MKKYDYKKISVDVIFDFLGSFIYAIGINIFTQPNNIAPGGVAGISIIINYLTELPIGLMTFTINVPLLIISYFKLGKIITLRTLKSVAIMSICIDLFPFSQYSYVGNLILSSLFGGVLIGTGLALVFMRGSTTGGIDIIVRVIQLKLRHFPIGKLTMFVDLFVLIAGAITFRNIESLMYGLITIFTSAKTIDTLIYGMYKGKVVHIFSDKSEEIAGEIIHTLDRGGTYLKAQGAFTKKDTNVLMCAVRNSQFPEVKKIVYGIDPRAFIIVSEAAEIVGEGFKDKDSSI
ncbi:MAG: YitT family protein [Oscillospiraceae bacterium]